MTLLKLAPAKINAFLEITGRQDNGYHLLQSLVLFVDVYDEVSLVPATDYSCVLDGEFAGGISTDANIVAKAFKLLETECGISQKYAVTLTKNIPVAAGLGGGSADAAAVLRMVGDMHSIDIGAHLKTRLCERNARSEKHRTGVNWCVNEDSSIAATSKFDAEVEFLDVSTDKLMELAARLGADVPMCFKQRPAFVAGIGDEFIGFPEMPQLHMVLVNPRASVATQVVYKAYHASNQKFSSVVGIWPEKFDSAEALCQFLMERDNVLSEHAINIAPSISLCLKLLSMQAGVLLARMSGSGATCFGIFTDSVAAQTACNNLKQQYPDYWVRSCRSIL